eukprot:1193455-Pyramimonas_sp.AAC.1
MAASTATTSHPSESAAEAGGGRGPRVAWGGRAGLGRGPRVAWGRVGGQRGGGREHRGQRRLAQPHADDSRHADPVKNHYPLPPPIVI